MAADSRLASFGSMLRGQLTGAPGEGVRMDELTLALYSTDASMYQIKPLAVCFPRSARDVQRIVEVAAELGLPVLPRGSASSLAGQAVAEAVVLDFTRHMNRIISVDPETRTATVEPGVVLDDLNRACAEHGLMVGSDPASSNRATIGGMVANNATGTHSIVHGNMERHVVSVRGVLADGIPVVFGELSEAEWVSAPNRDGLEGAVYRGVDALLSDGRFVIERDTSRHWRRNSGYRLETMLDPASRNMARLLCGSEGTLAVLTEITIRLVPRPAFTALGVVHFHERAEALRSVTTLLGTKPSAIELLDGVAIRQCRAMPSFAARMGFVRGEPGAVLITEYAGESLDETRAGLERLGAAVGAGGCGYATVECTAASDISAVWLVRKEALGLIMGLKGDYKPLAFIEDASVPVEHLANYIDRLDEFIASTDTPVVYYAHASAGCLHVRPFIDTKRASEVEKMVRISRRSMELVRALGGSVSSEHGDGLARSWLNPEFLGPDLYRANVDLKRIFDPRNILNPGKVVEAPPMQEHLRFGADYATTPIKSRLDFSRDAGLEADVSGDGFARAVELCTGIGACRKTASGTMCPSFMVTGDEWHTTRGRANALRAALSGHVAPDLLYSPEMGEVLELCIQCKACKSECPTGVDMAALKTEWLYQRRRGRGLSLGDTIFARMPDVARRVRGPVARFVNAVNNSWIGRVALEKALGVDRRRRLPPFAPTSFVQSLPAAGGVSNGERPAVVLFPDTFSNYNEPHVAAAALAVLERVGYDVIVPRQHVCCGRTRLSKGDLDGAADTLAATIEVLHPLAGRGLRIVGLEPSCIHTFGDEGLRLFPRDGRVALVAGACRSLERFVAEDEHGLFARAEFREFGGRALLHGHCHQKAIEGTSYADALLARASRQPETLDTSCCGMAGSFGYQREHADISRQMAERRLAPAVRAMSANDVIVAAGSSCRAQIRDVTGRAALHPAEVLAASLGV